MDILLWSPRKANDDVIESKIWKLQKKKKSASCNSSTFQTQTYFIVSQYIQQVSEQHFIAKELKRY